MSQAITVVTKGHWAAKFTGTIETGQRFGKLTVISLDKDRTLSGVARRFWKCTCDCGSAYLAREDHLRREAVKSCGCGRKGPNGRRAFNAKPPGHAAARQMMTCCRIRASKRGLEFSLTFEQFLEIVLRPCAYCGIIESMEYGKNRVSTSFVTNSRFNGSFVCNGVDREDSNVGYTLQNSVSCCWFCNRAKNDSSPQEFKAWIDRLISFQLAQKDAS